MLIVGGVLALVVTGLGGWWWWVNWIPTSMQVSSDWITAHRYDRRQHRQD
jgi:hypothetical protein